MPLSEFDLINRYFASSATSDVDVDVDVDVELAIGDDAAVVNVPSGQSLVMSLDTLVAGVHFPENTSAEDVAWKALAVNLSDMAAMAATPRWLLLGLTLPQSDEVWLKKFSNSLNELMDTHGLTLIGGDTTRGPLTVTIQINGLAPQGQLIKRDGAHPGDLIYVSGQLGDAGLGLLLALGKTEINLPVQRQRYFLQRLNRPTPRIELGLALRGLATAMIDVSDGLLADLSHILKSSDVGATINIEKLPLADELLGLSEEWWSMPLSAGDDYELCFSIPPENQTKLDQAMKAINCPIQCIGRIESIQGLRLLHHGTEISAEGMEGYIHFD